MKDLAVIIPCFNSEATITRAIESVVSQTDSMGHVISVEIIVVDDGSSDASCEIVSGLKSPLVKLLHNQKTKGVSGARNTGLACTDARWITFLDSDDEFAPDALSIFREHACDGCGEILAFNANSIDVDTESRNTVIGFHLKDVSIADELKLEYASAITGFPKGAGFCSMRGMMGVVWSVFFSHDLVLRTGLTFDERLSFMEDLKFKLAAVLDAKSIDCYTETTYNYYSSDASLMRRKDSAREQSLGILMLEASRKDWPFIEISDDARKYLLCKCFLQVLVDNFDCERPSASCSEGHDGLVSDELMRDIIGSLSAVADSFSPFQRFVLYLGARRAHVALRFVFRLKRAVKSLGSGDLQ